MARAREHLFRQAAEHAPLVLAETDFGSFVVSTTDLTVGRSLFVDAVRGEMKVLGRATELLARVNPSWTPAGATFVDIGANIGTTAITALLAEGFREVLACEPNLENHRLLRVNAVLNRLDGRLHALNAAVSTGVGQARLAISHTNSGAHRLKDQVAGSSSKSPVVEVVSLDWLCDRGILDPDRVGLLWIDVQGHEGHVLAGARSLVERGVPVVLEFHPRHIKAAHGWAAMLKAAQLGYTHFAALRGSTHDGPGTSLRPVSEIKALGARLQRREGSGEMADLLLVRTPA